MDGKILAEGSTDANGNLTESIPPGAQYGLLLLGEDQREIAINFGHVDPIEEVSGIQTRLRNLGFYDGEVDDINGPLTTAAIAEFQRSANISGDGGTPTSATIRWDQFVYGDKQRSSDKPVKITKGDLFDAGDTYAAYEYGGDALKKIHIRAFRLAYDGGKGALVTTVTLRYPDHPNTIRCRKLVMKHGTTYGVTVDDDEVTSDLYV